MLKFLETRRQKKGQKREKKSVYLSKMHRLFWEQTATTTVY